jgi:hypothetical protein
MRYEDLMANPIGQMRTLYEQLDLGGFDDLKPRLDDYLAKNSNYEKNQFQLTPAQRQIISHRWGDVIRRYGYAVEPHYSLPVEPAPQPVAGDGSTMPAEPSRYAEGAWASQQPVGEAHMLRG